MKSVTPPPPSPHPNYFFFQHFWQVCKSMFCRRFLHKRPSVIFWLFSFQLFVFCCDILFCWFVHIAITVYYFVYCCLFFYSCLFICCYLVLLCFVFCCLLLFILVYLFTSASGWLKDTDHELIRRVSRRIEDVTGLTMDTAEELQVWSENLRFKNFSHPASRHMWRYQFYLHCEE